MEKHKLDKTLICRCEEVSRQEIEASIADGANSLAAVKRRTRAGKGLCQGRTCSRLVAQILAEKTGLSPAEVQPPNPRPPVRPIPISCTEDSADE